MSGAEVQKLSWDYTLIQIDNYNFTFIRYLIENEQEVDRGKLSIELSNWTKLY
jgi:hypothetical protein